MKAKRHAKILEIIRKYDVDTQEELCVRLNEAGYKVTQATVSRDIRELKLTKVASKVENRNTQCCMMPVKVWRKNKTGCSRVG